MSTGTSGSVSSSTDLTSVRAIATKDFQDAVRSWLFWGLSLLFFFLLALITGAISYFGEDITAEGVTTEALVVIVSQVTSAVIPLIALVLGWKAIAGERESGTIKIMLSLPHSRKDVILGKLIGRSAVLSLSLVVGFVLAAVIVAIGLGGFDVVDYVGLLAVSVVYGVAYTSIAVAISALARSTTVAAASAFGVFILFYVVWNALLIIFSLLSSREVLFFEFVAYTGEINDQEFQGQRLQSWMYLVHDLDPGNAYANVLSLATSAADIEGANVVQAEMFGGSVPFYLQDWFALVILAFWIVVPLGVALYRFDRGDL